MTILLPSIKTIEYVTGSGDAVATCAVIFAVVNGFDTGMAAPAMYCAMCSLLAIPRQFAVKYKSSRLYRQSRVAEKDQV